MFPFVGENSILFGRAHMQDVKKLIGKQIKILRQASGMSQEELAEKVSLSAKYLSRIERGNANPTLDTFMKLADSLQVEVSELLHYEYEKSPKELKQFISRIAREDDEAKLRLAAKILKAVYR